MMSKKTKQSSLPPLRMPPLPVVEAPPVTRVAGCDDKLYEKPEESTGATTLDGRLLELEVDRVYEQGVTRFREETSSACADVLGELQGEMSAMSGRQIRAFETQLSERHSAIVREEERLRNAFFAFTEEQLLEFQKSIVVHYQKRNCTLSLTPSVPTNDEHLDKFYISPSILDRKAHSQPFVSSVTEPPAPVRCFRGVFYHNNYIAHNIYMEGESGIGKSAFCAKIVLEWCRFREHEYTHAQDIHVRDEASDHISGLGECNTRLHAAGDGFRDGSVLGEFRFLFVVCLRDASEVECDIDQMIMHQVVKYLPMEYDLTFLKAILAHHRCLVLLDGLDEWLHPERNIRQCACKRSTVVPFCRTRTSCTVLTTTRHWKMANAKLRDSEIDKHLEIVGLENTDDLINRVLGSLNSRYGRTLMKEQFDQEVDMRHCRHLIARPIICMQLLSLWYDGHLHSSSVARIYSSMVDMLFRRARDKKEDAADLGASSALYQSFGSSDVELPRFYQLHRNIIDNCNFFLKLCKLAFDTLFTLDRESSIVFDGKVVNKYLSGLEWIAALETGILSQTQSLSTLTERRTMYTFMHRSFQEFLAAAFLHVRFARLEEALESLLWVTDSEETGDISARLSDLLEEMYRGQI
ncbi:uncharacterized protein LOC127842536 [Dreissena polymorpha]|uniref:NACHT domain-containing protein n=1 Tax=Dreissena polymorpha TaxID=45954 RepID=A0A9D4F1Z9_DREPO|nr:uncharacterized protein LOC127842536 [Dreissena polymorpha]KAH3788175.1 hypothetical protein DPMN_166308 [Dreissena polymorpha]